MYIIYNKLERIRLGNDLIILIINTFASFSLGVFLSLLPSFSSVNSSYQLLLFFSIGFSGSFSTFSTFIYNLYELLIQLQFYRALKLFFISVTLGILAFAAGYLIRIQ